MKRLLFVIPGLKTGGTNSSLESLYTIIKTITDVKILSLSYFDKDQNYSFETQLISGSSFLSYICTNHRNLKGYKRYICILIKISCRLLRVLGINMNEYVFKKEIDKIERENNFDYIIAYEEGIATRFVSLFKMQNKIAWVHCDYDNYLKTGLSEVSIYQEFKQIVCVSQYTASVFKVRYPVLADRTIFIYNLVNSSYIQEQALKPLEDGRFKNDRFTILSVGRFNRVKQFSLIPQIAASLKKRGVLFYWYILGPQTTYSDFDDYQKNLDLYRVKDCVFWLGPKENPYPYFKASDLYVCVSKSEACPMVFIEARMCGLNIVSTSFPSVKEFINNGINGFIGDIDNVSELIVEQFRNPLKVNENRHEYISNQMVKIKDLFSIT